MEDKNVTIPVGTRQAPAAIGPYSQGVQSGGFLFVSGQLPIDPETGEFVAGDIQARTHQCLKNVAAIAHAAGTDIHRAVKVTVFLTNMGDFGQVNDAYGQHFGENFPARSAVQVVALPKGSDVEVEAIISV